MWIVIRFLSLLVPLFSSKTNISTFYTHNYELEVVMNYVLWRISSDCTYRVDMMAPSLTSPSAQKFPFKPSFIEGLCNLPFRAYRSNKDEEKTNRKIEAYQYRSLMLPESWFQHNSSCWLFVVQTHGFCSHLKVSGQDARIICSEWYLHEFYNTLQAAVLKLSIHKYSSYRRWP